MHVLFRRKVVAPPVRRILVAHDLSYRMQDVEAVAARLAKAMGAAVHVVVVGSDELHAKDVETDVLFGHVVEDAGAAAAEVRRRFQALGVPAEVHVERGSVAQALLAVERRLAPDLMLVGHTPRAQMEFAGHGSVIDQVKNEVVASLLVVHAAAFDAIAVGVDGSASSLHAAAVAAHWAKALGLELTVLVGAGARTPKGIDATTERVEEPAGKSLLDWTQQHPRSLLVVGARGLGNPGLLRMGSVSDRLTWGAGSSVLVVRAPRT